MKKSSQFNISRKELNSILIKFKKLEGNAKKRNSTIEITVLTGFIELAIPGIKLKISAETEGSSKITMRLWYFHDIVKSESDSILTFTIFENQLKLRTLTFPAQTTFFEDDRILRSINIPLNYSYIDLAKLVINGNFTDEEIAFNNLDEATELSLKKVKKDIVNVFRILRKYDIKELEIKDFILSKLSE
jgi:hypothetical protein